MRRGLNKTNGFMSTLNLYSSKDKLDGY
jgi:hypothetical protein